MNELALYAFASAIAVSLVSLIGVASFSLNQSRLQKATKLLVCLAAGAMLGNAILHLLPHALDYHSDAGHVEHHQPAAVPADPHHHGHGHHHDHDHDHHPVLEHDHGAAADHDHDHEHGVTPDHDHGATVDHDHDHDAADTHRHEHPGLGVAALILAGLLGMLTFDLALLSRVREEHDVNKPVGYMVLFSDGLENLIDGMAIGTAFLVSIPLGVATTLAVFAHEIPVEMGDFAVMLKAGFSRKKALVLNFLSGLVAVVGVAIALYLGSVVPTFSAYATPIAAGAFIYIAGTALLPQIRSEGSGRDKLVSLVMVLVGVGVMALILLIE